MNTKSITICIILLAFCLFFTGCDNLRFGPSQSQKQTAELTHILAQKIAAEGAAPASDAAMQLKAGTRAAAVYMGPSVEPPDIGAFDVIAQDAAAEASARPGPNDIFDTADQGLDLAYQLAILFGFGGGGIAAKSALSWITKARSKSKALGDIITGNELLKEWLIRNERYDELDAFKELHRSVQSGKTPQIVAIARTDNPLPPLMKIEPPVKQSTIANNTNLN